MTDILHKTIELDYDAKNILHPDYFFHKLVPNEGSQPITNSAGGGETITFNLPAERVFNPGKSYLQFNFTASAASAHWQYVPADCIPMFRIVDWSPTSGPALVHVEDYDHLSKLTGRPRTLFSDYVTNNAESTFSRCSVVAAQNISGQKLPSALADYVEPAFWFKNLVDNNAISQNVRIPLERFTETALSINKDLFMGQISVLQFTLKPTQQWLTIANDQYDPASAGNGPYDAAQTISINNAQLMLCIERNPMIVQSVKTDFALGKHEMIIPYVKKISKTTVPAGQASTGNVSLRLYPKDGFKVARIYHGLFQNEYAYGAGTTSGMLNTSVNGIITRGTVGGVPTSNFTTSWNSLQRQENSLILGTDDYEILRSKFIGSCYMNRASYQNNWVWIENFADPGSLSEENLPMSNRIIGEDITSESIWEFSMTAPNNNVAFSMYTFPVALKRLRASRAGVEIFP